jgi:hypothetical protein
LLGFAPAARSEALYAALAALPGPAMSMLHGTGVAAFMQTEPSAPLIRRGRKALLSGLHTVQRRLEVACQAGPFLPMDPAAATGPASVISHVLQDSWAELGAALGAHGSRQQWDVVLRWEAEKLIAQHRAELAPIAASGAASGKAALAEAVAGVLARGRALREAALVAALAPVALALSKPIGGETEVAVTLLVPSGGESAIESGLGTLSWAGADAEEIDALAVDLRGPLPPISFTAAQLLAVEPSEVAQAWARLRLPKNIDAAGLHAQWRQLAAASHPDRQPDADPTSANAAVAELTAAYHILRPLWRGPNAQTPLSLPEVLRRAGHRLVIPPVSASETVAPPAEPALAEMVE